MRHSEGVEVYLKSHSQEVPYDEYTKPQESVQISDYHMRCYIEARTDDRFSIVTKVVPGFSWSKTAGLLIQVFSGDCKRAKFFHRPDLRRRPEELICQINEIHGTLNGIRMC